MDGHGVVRFVDIPGFFGYRAGSDGSVWSRWKRGTGGIGIIWRVLSPIIQGNGYMQVAMRSDCGVITRKSVHVVIAESFHGPRPNGMLACHNDGDKSNNAPSNIRWATPKENMDDKIIHGTQFYGEKSGRAVTDDYTAIRLRKRYAEVKKGMRKAPNGAVQVLSREFGLNQHTVAYICTRGWKHLDGK